jgi:hypothetical protein
MYLFNDKKKLNYRYRSGLINELEKNSISVSNVGVFDSCFELIKTISILFFTNKKYISSNMKCNILCMIFFWKSGTVIVNGLGRHKKSSMFRTALKCLFLLNKEKEIIFQNYTDYRFFRLHSSNSSIFWVPGSGGSKRATGKSKDITIISRDEKIDYSTQSILTIRESEKTKKIHIIGCSKEKIEKIFNDKDIVGCGYVNQDDIFNKSRVFFQPSGYGEGVPHTLVDALCSNMEVIISKKDFISFGLHKLNFDYKKTNQEIVTIEPFTNNSTHLENEKINIAYCSIILRKERREYTHSLSS